MRLRPLPTLLTGHQDTGEKPGRFIRVMSVDRHLQVSICLLQWHACCAPGTLHAMQPQPLRISRSGV